MYLAFGDCQSRLLGASNRQGGFIGVQKDSVVDVAIELLDINGNRSKVLFQLVGRQEAAGLDIPEGAEVLTCDREYNLRNGNYSL